MVGVKALVDSGIHIVPDAYLKHGGCGTHQLQVAELPLVDLESKDRASQVLAIDKACREWGTFQLVGHGVPIELMESMRHLVHRFFDMPAEERALFYSEDKTKPVRFGTSFNPSQGSKQFWYDYLTHVCNPVFKQEDVPKNVPNYWEITAEYVKQVAALSTNLLGFFSEGLGLPADALEKNFADPWHALRMNYYPVCPDPEVAVGIDSHTDLGGLTILLQDKHVEGLQVFHDGKWMVVKPKEGALVVSMGDQMEILTNGEYKSLVHRVVVNPTTARVSVGSFYSPNKDTFVAPVVTSDDKPTLYEGYKFGDYRELYFSKAFTDTPAIQHIMRA